MPYGQAIITVEGRLGKDAELRTVGEKKVLNFRLAMTEKVYGKKDENGKAVTRTDWYGVESWSPFLAKLQPYLLKGAFVSVTGKLKQREYQGEGGEKKVSLDIDAFCVNFLSDPRKDGEKVSAPAAPAAPSAPPPEANPGGADDDLPF